MVAKFSQFLKWESLKVLQIQKFKAKINVARGQSHWPRRADACPEIDNQSYFQESEDQCARRTRTDCAGAGWLAVGPFYGSSWLRSSWPFCTSSSSALTTDGSMAAYLVPWNCSKWIWKERMALVIRALFYVLGLKQGFRVPYKGSTTVRPPSQC